MYQIQTHKQAKQGARPEETQEKCPIKVIQTTRARPSLSLPVYLEPHVLFFLLINTGLASLLSISVWKLTSTQATS